MWRWSDSLNFLSAEDFGRTRPLSMSAFARVDSSMAFERRDDRADCVRDTVNRVGRRRWKRPRSLLLRFRIQQVRQASKGWHELSSIYEERGITTTFVGWLLCEFNRCPKPARVAIFWQNGPQGLQLLVDDRGWTNPKYPVRQWTHEVDLIAGCADRVPRSIATGKRRLTIHRRDDTIISSGHLHVKKG